MCPISFSKLASLLLAYKICTRLSARMPRAGEDINLEIYNFLHSMIQHACKLGSYRKNDCNFRIEKN